MERGRRVAIAVVGLVVMLLTTGVILRTAGSAGGGRLKTDAERGSVDALGDQPPDSGIQPGDPPGVRTIPLPDFSATSARNTPGSAGTSSGPAFPGRGVWVVKADGTSPILVAKDAEAGVAVGGTWVAFVEGDTLRAVRRSDLRTKVDLASGVSGTAAQGLPIAGGRRGVAFLKGGQALLVDPASPSQPVASFAAPAGDAVTAEEDGEGRLVWADADGLHVGSQAAAAPVRVQRGLLVMGYDLLAHLEDGRVAITNGPSLDWGQVDRLQAGPAGMVAATGGKVHLRTRSGDDRALLDRASTPVVTRERLFYVSSSRSLASASLAGIDIKTLAEAGPGRSITNLDPLDDSTLVVTVS